MSLVEESYNSDNSLIKTTTLKKYKFMFGAGMQNQWIESNILFLDFVASSHEQIVKASIEARELVVTKADEAALPKFKEKEDTELHLSGLEY